MLLFQNGLSTGPDLLSLSVWGHRVVENDSEATAKLIPNASHDIVSIVEGFDEIIF